MKVKNQSEVAQSGPTLSNPMDRSLTGSSVHGIFQARVLEWGAIAFSEESPRIIIISIVKLVPFFQDNLFPLLNSFLTATFATTNPSQLAYQIFLIIREYLTNIHFRCYLVGVLICISLIMSSEKAMAPHSSTLAWKIPWTEEPVRLQSMGLLKVGHD